MSIQPRLYEHDGKSLTVKQWAAHAVVSENALYRRLAAGWPVERAISEPAYASVGQRITFNGETLTLTEWARKTGINRAALWERISTHGWSIERALTTPLRKKAARK